MGILPMEHHGWDIFLVGPGWVDSWLPTYQWTTHSSLGKPSLVIVELASRGRAYFTVGPKLFFAEPSPTVQLHINNNNKNRSYLRAPHVMLIFAY
jgi:hypothetical protein